MTLRTSLADFRKSFDKRLLLFVDVESVRIANPGRRGLAEDQPITYVNQVHSKY